MTIHNLTTQQLYKITDAIGDGSGFPKHTDDPRVNFAVDCIVQMQVDGDEPTYDEQSYVEEIRAVKISEAKKG